MITSFFQNFLAKTKFIKKISRGFTLIELIVVMAIMMIVTAVVLYNYKSFNSQTLITNYAYEVAFAIKEAQVYGLSVLKGSAKGFASSKAGFQQGYGIHFDNASLSTPSSFVLFNDFPTAWQTSPVGDAAFTPSADEKSINTYTLSGRYRVKQYCGYKGSTPNCISDSGSKISLDITFVRPNPDAVIHMTGVSNPYDRAEITIVSPQEGERKVVVYSTGQISIPSISSSQ